MKSIRYDPMPEGKSYGCHHMQNEATCQLTGRECVGINKNWDSVDGGWVECFYQNAMERCPMFNLDFVRLLREPVSELIRKENERRKQVK